MKQKSIGLFAATFFSLGLVSAGSAEAITLPVCTRKNHLKYPNQKEFSKKFQ